MSIPIEFMNIIIPIAVIEAKYPGGWAQCQIDLQVNEAGSPRWSDGELFRDGAMNHWDMNAIIGFWEELGLVGEFGRGSTRRWKDTTSHMRTTATKFLVAGRNGQMSLNKGIRL